MLARLASVVCSVLLFAVPAVADGGRVLSESDTGIVWGDLDCEITKATASAPILHQGDWGYLYAYVEIATTCVDWNGREWHQTGADDVWFPTVTWDRVAQTWTQDGVVVAKRKDFRTVEVNPDLDFTVWTSEEDSQVAFKVQARTRE